MVVATVVGLYMNVGGNTFHVSRPLFLPFLCPWLHEGFVGIFRVHILGYIAPYKYLLWLWEIERLATTPGSKLATFGTGLELWRPQWYSQGPGHREIPNFGGGSQTLVTSAAR